MIWGPFRGAKGKDLICVQSMDGLLSFFHHENYFLPDFLVPSPLGYLPRTDSIVQVGCLSDGVRVCMWCGARVCACMGGCKFLSCGFSDFRHYLLQQIP